MSFEWNEYFNLAKVLADEEGSKCTLAAKQRASISRAYYSAFHSARSYLKKIKEYPTNERGIHTKIRNWFLSEGKTRRSKVLSDIGSKYDSMLTYRTNADYYDDFPELNSEFVIDQLLTTEEILEKLNYLIQNNLKS